MAKPSVLDELIEETEPPRRSLKLERVLAELTDTEHFDELLDMLNAPIRTWGHKRMAGIIRSYADRHGVDHEKMDEKDISAWRERQVES